MEHDLFAAVQPSELLGLNFQKLDDPAAGSTRDPCLNFRKLRCWFNVNCLWVSNSVVQHEDVVQRARCIERFIRIAEKMMNPFHNFNGLMGLMGGLTANSVYRLRKTWDRVGKKYIVSKHYWT